MPLSLLHFCLRYFCNIDQSRVDSHRPLKMSSEFPRNFCISIVLVLFLLVLFCLAGEISYYLLKSLMNAEDTFSLSSFLYFLAYVLANFLFITHLTLYFGYREELEIGSETLRIKQGFFHFGFEKTIPMEQVLYSQIKQNMLGNYHVELYYYDEHEKTRKVVLGTYLVDDHISLLFSKLRPVNPY